ncbi:alpha-amylase family glycosyl hydrolase [Paenibacillus sp. MMS20-IR301]|uniref:alpha-amylase family glycosyl hydrolase n=1 Tax=Paenibacillus sp. MMS20-IR301 TaxID=2895946 RepID=UPI0028EA50AD|nr:alpha-amylase family glycosyl hydrolase [Paenibacillus sp. MMS20-IR301]WNS44215.1 alpha-amylase family glycosyl hydrolase [Paenibacillus sp. MMS20-IR301]
MAKQTDITLRNQVVYSIYVRNHSEEGTFRAVEKDLERIKGLGVDIIWLLPVHPVGREARKGGLGSPYANQDYREINPELGSLEEFRALTGAIHRHGMKCMIDVVYNHTSPDSWLVRHHPEFFYRTPEGKLGNRVGDWGDIVDLDYGNQELWAYQLKSLVMWAELVDGFRCDVAPLLPLEFWLRAREAVAAVNPGCLWLAESIEPEFTLHLRQRGMVSLSDSEILQAFDACYDYDTYPYFTGVLNGSIPLSSYVEKINAQEYIYPANYVKLRFLENHDRPRAKALFPDENELINWTAFMYFQKGMPLIYGGQETENEICPDLFDKNPVNWHTGKDLSWLFQALYPIKKSPVMTHGICRLTAHDEDGIVTGIHSWGGQKLAGVFSLRGKPAEAELELPDGDYVNLIDGSPVSVAGGKLHCSGKPVIVEA